MIPAIHYLFYIMISLLAWAVLKYGLFLPWVMDIVLPMLKLSFCSLFAKQSLTGINFD